MSHIEDKFEKSIRRTLDQSLEDLDAQTSAKIRQLKYRAIEQSEQKKPRKWLWKIAPAVTILLIMVSLNLRENNNVQITSVDLPELNILTSTEPLEFYAEEIEFYLWLAETMETETELFDSHPAVPADLHAPSSRAGETGRRNLTQLRVDSVSWSLRG